MSGRRGFLCDFDGTVAPADIGAALVRRFTAGREAEREALLARWRAGALGHRQLTEAQCALVEVGEAEALAFTRGFAVDAGFPAFARAAAAQGDAVVVVSEGFGFYVRDLLARAGLGGLPVYANEAEFRGGRLVPRFPHAAAGCGACGNCKAQHVRRLRAGGYRTVVIGDGLSDRCGARAADEVLACGDLLDWCRREGVAATPFAGFGATAAGAGAGV